MGQSMVSFRMDENLKKSMDQVCKDMGMSTTTAFIIFATKVSREKRIPFEINTDPFYSAENLRCLDATLPDIEAQLAAARKEKGKTGSK